MPGPQRAKSRSTTVARLGGRGQLATMVLWLVMEACGCAFAQPALPTLRGEHLIRPQSAEAVELEALPARLEKEGIVRLRLDAAPLTAGDAGRRVVQAVQGGALDLAVVPLATLASHAPRFRVFEIPFLFLSNEHAMAVQFTPSRFELLETLPRAGLEGVGWWPGESLVLASGRPVLEPLDLFQLRAATLSARNTGQASALRLFREKAGANPVEPLPGEALAGLPEGAVDVVETRLTELHRLAPGETRLSVTLTDHLYAGYVIIANPSAWAKLTSNVRELLTEELRRAHDDAVWKVRDAVRAADRALRGQQGTTVFHLPGRIRQQWRDALRSESLAGPAGFAFVEAVAQFSMESAGVTRGGGPSISWNAWFEAGSETAPKDVGALEVNRVYRFYLDLARYPYTEALSASPGRPITELLKGEGERRLLLQPVLLGAELEAAPGQALRPRELTVKLERASEDPEDEALLEAFDNRTLTTRALSREVNLGQFVSWDIKASVIGCGGIAVTVWDHARVTPLDHIVLQIPVREGDDGPKECAWQNTPKSMNAGLLTLLGGPTVPAGDRVADAALHVFESEDDGKTRSHAVLIHRERLLAALADPNATDAGVYSWRLASVLSAYVSLPSQMPALIKAAHAAVGQGSARPFPYEDVASELALKIFSGVSPHDQAEAARARSALAAAIRDATEPAVVVRLVAANGATLFVPLGLLAAHGAQPVVAKRFTVIQPLPQPRPFASSCIDEWRAARPRELQGVGGDARDLLREAADAPAAAGITVIDNHGALAQFLQGGGSVKDGGKGLIVLAHHDQGYLKFNDADRPPARIAHEFITRRFPPGSAAMLAACTTVGDLGQTRDIVDRFARQGVDALIVSPFLVDAEFGTRLAIEFEKVVAQEHVEHSGATLRKLFERTAAKVASVYQNQAAFQDMALEFMLIGNPEIRLCQ